MSAKAPTFAQYPPGGYPPGYPRPYPGGTGPGLPLPQKKKKQPQPTKAEEVNLESLRGMLLRRDEKEVVLEAGDRRILTIRCSEKTRYLRDGKEVDPASLRPGDHLAVEASRDDRGYYDAVNVRFEKEGTAEEQARSSQEVESMQGAAGAARETSEKGAEAGESRPLEPESRSVELSRFPDDEGPPKLARGVPPKRTPDSASAPPASGAALEDPREQPAAGEEGNAPPSVDPVIEKAREVSEVFVETLPNYVVKQVTTRYVSTTAKVDWRAQDHVSADVVFEDGQEEYRNILLNGKPPKQDLEQTGTWSTGEYAAVLRSLLAPWTRADFRSKGSRSFGNRPVYCYDFSVEQPYSNWTIRAAAQTYRPAYVGTVFIDRETHRVMRIEMQARHLPKEFPMDTVESATDYDFVRIGDGSYVLPVHSENLSCIRGTTTCSHNVIDFRNYRKFGAESSVSFGK